MEHFKIKGKLDIAHFTILKMKMLKSEVICALVVGLLCLLNWSSLETVLPVPEGQA